MHVSRPSGKTNLKVRLLKTRCAPLPHGDLQKFVAYHMETSRHFRLSPTGEVRHQVQSLLVATSLTCVAGSGTAWSSRATVNGMTFSARYWYSGKNINDAREDVAECVVVWLSSAMAASEAQTSS